MKIKMLCMDLHRQSTNFFYDEQGQALKEPIPALVDTVLLSALTSTKERHLSFELKVFISDPEFVGTFKVGQHYEIDVGLSAVAE